MGLISKEQILQADDRPREQVPVPEWGGDVLVWGATGYQRDWFEQEFSAAREEERKVDNIRAKLLAWCICDQHGKPLFEAGDIKALGAKSGVVLSRLFDVAKRLSGIGEQAADELEKN